MIMVPIYNRAGTVVAHAKVDDEDAWVLNVRWHLHQKGYASKNDNRRRCDLMHRKILEMQSGHMCDHANGDKLDNRRSNLRECNYSQNGINCKLSKRNTSGYVGVSLKNKNGKYIAQIGNRHNGKFRVIYLGQFDTAREAAMVRDARVKEMHGEFFRNINNVL
jgi:hypothetical protein